MRHAHTLRRLAPFMIKKRYGKPIGHHIEHGNLYFRTLPGDASSDKRLKYRRISRPAGCDINDRNPNPRRLRRPARDRTKT